MAYRFHEANARRLFRQALFLHYMEGLEADIMGRVEQWLRTHGGWFRDQQETYEPDVVDDDLNVLSSNHLLALTEAANITFNLALAVAEKNQREIGELVEGNAEAMAPGLSDNIRLASDLLFWHRQLAPFVMGVPEDFDASLGGPGSSARDTTVTSIINPPNPIRNSSRSRSRGGSSSGGNSREESDVEDVLVGPGLMRGRRDTVETSGHRFTGTAHRLE